MAKSKECTICKHYGKEVEQTEVMDHTSIYDNMGNAVPIVLCREHSVDLFKKGQKKFLMSHYQILVDLVDSNEKRFLEVLEQTVKKNVDALY
ncbi:MAG: hypothetical protein N4A33_08440 [Bacteriovoracaceae bacterium]|jgi:hypothetical protein|nr:hypothetical protein [Bacteriovoracaceae bacterium]